MVDENGKCGEKSDEQYLASRHASIHGYWAGAGLEGSMFSARVLYDDGSQHTLWWCNVQAGQHQAIFTVEWHDLGTRPRTNAASPFTIV